MSTYPLPLRPESTEASVLHDFTEMDHAPESRPLERIRAVRVPRSVGPGARAGQAPPGTTTGGLSPHGVHPVRGGAIHRRMPGAPAAVLGTPDPAAACVPTDVRLCTLLDRPLSVRREAAVGAGQPAAGGADARAPDRVLLQPPQLGGQRY